MCVIVLGKKACDISASWNHTFLGYMQEVWVGGGINFAKLHAI